MTRQVVEQDGGGNPTVIVYTESPDDLAETQADLREQGTRARDVARSLSATSH